MILTPTIALGSCPFSELGLLDLDQLHNVAAYFEELSFVLNKCTTYRRYISQLLLKQSY